MILQKMGTRLKGGKTAPLLVQDILAFDPQHLAPSGFNPLTDLPVPNPDGAPLPPSLSSSRCRHEWSLHKERSTLDKIRRPPRPGSYVRLASDCINCRSHLDIGLDYQEVEEGNQLCPNLPDFPLHHFSVDPWHDVNGAAAESCSSYEFICSSPDCKIKVRVEIRPPLIKDEWLPLMTNSDILRKRHAKALTDSPNRFEGTKAAEPSEVLNQIITYAWNALDKGDSRPIPSENKKFKLVVGEECAPIMGALGFRLMNNGWHPPGLRTNDVDDLETNGQESSRADKAQTVADERMLSSGLRELQILRWQRSTGGSMGSDVNAPFVPQADNTKQFIAASLDALDYKKSLKSRTLRLHSQTPPVYGALGCMEDFDDSLLVFAYDQQILHDPDNAPIYLECLQKITDERQTTDLQTKIVMEASCGRVSKKDVRNAYQQLGLNQDLDDDTIAGIFKSRIADAPAQAAETRNMLKIIGDDRDSSSLQLLASESVTTYEEALRFLELEDNTDIDMIPTMYTFKVENDPNSMPLARHAVQLIADKKDSSALRTFLDTGSMVNDAMDVGEAYRNLGIDNREAADDTILAVYQSRLFDQPESSELYTNCLKRIAEDKDSVLLKHHLGENVSAEPYQAGNSSMPVGLENIGNTCYFNSLLQFYFTIKPLRELVLDFEKHEMLADVHSMGKKQVGSRQVTPREVLSAKRFVQELRKLFQSMITSPSAQVKPAMELARLALFGASTADYERRQSIRSSHRPSLGEIDGRPVLGPTGPPLSTSPLSPRRSAPIPEPIAEIDENRDVEMTEEAGNSDVDSTKAETAGSEKSDNTLIGDDEVDTAAKSTWQVQAGGAFDKQKQAIEDKENSPFTQVSNSSLPNDHAPLPLGETSASKMNMQPTETEPPTVKTSEKDDTNMIVPMAPPSRPPPVPPRRNQPEEGPSIQEQIRIGAQQDVTEVIGNILFQLECAIKPQSIDKKGEQLDQIKDLFYGIMNTYMTNREGATRTNDEYFSDIKINVVSGPRDIYAALDETFDVQEVEIGGGVEPQYSTISRLPPVLSFHVQRAQYDIVKSQSFKSANHLDLKDTIYMDRYVDKVDDEIRAKREQCWTWKKDIATLEASKKDLHLDEIGMNAAPAIREAKRFIIEFDKDGRQNHVEAQDEDGTPTPLPPSDVDSFNGDLFDLLDQEANLAQLREEDIDIQITDLQQKISHQFDAHTRLPYRLQSVFIHTGSEVSSGHYWIYIHDFKTGIWRKYNDTYVTEVENPQLEIFAPPKEGSRAATSYFVCYVQADRQEELAEAVKRDIIKEEEVWGGGGGEQFPQTDGNMVQTSFSYEPTLEASNNNVFAQTTTNDGTAPPPPAPLAWQQNQTQDRNPSSTQEPPLFDNDEGYGSDGNLGTKISTHPDAEHSGDWVSDEQASQGMDTRTEDAQTSYSGTTGTASGSRVSQW